MRASLCTAFLFLVSLPALGAEAPITLDVDLRDVTRQQVHARLVIPVKPGEVELAFPKWIPGEHGATGPVTDLAGLVIRAAGGAPLAWRRDELDPWTFVVKVPAGVTALDVALDHLLPPEDGSFSAGAGASAKLAVLSWNQVLLHPKGARIGDLLVAPRVRLPDGWSAASALPGASRAGATVSFAPVSLEMLVDSPLAAGVHVREIPLGTLDGREHAVSAFADTPEALEVPAETKAAWERLVVEAGALFGARHYDRYRFLVSLSNETTHFGLEHHQSSDNRMAEKALTDPDLRLAWATLLPHEYVHSWNGKHRRPAAMITRDFQEPQRTSLLWIYEGLTNYYAGVLAARSGLFTPEQFREWVALVADQASTQKGRAWRPLEDTAVDAHHLYGSRDDGAAWRRDTDFYTEGALLWLEADALVREISGGKASLDDFARRFYGGESGGPAVKGYTLADVVRELGAVAPYDWNAFFEERVRKTRERPPLAGIERAGWRLGVSEKQSGVAKGLEARRKKLLLGSSVGIVVKKEGGVVVDVVPGTPADAAKIGPGATIVAVNGRRYTPDVLLAAVKATKDGRPLELLLESDDFFRTAAVEWRGGLSYPVLERIEGKPDLLSAISAPRAPAGP